MSDKNPLKIDLKKSRRARLSDLTSQIDKEYKGVVGVGSRMRLTPGLRRISTTSLSLDYVLGGGIPEGRITMFLGAEHSGKSTHAARIAAEAQRLCRRCMRPVKDLEVVPCDDDGSPLTSEQIQEYEANGIVPDYWQAVGSCDCIKKSLVAMPKQEKGEKASDYSLRLESLMDNSYEEFIVAWCDLEMALDWDWIARLGVDERRLLYSRPETGEEAVDTLDPLLRSGSIDLLVIDSIAHLIPSVEIEETMYKQQQGVMARLVNKGVRKFVSALAACANEFGRVPTQVWINQERDKLGPFPGTVTPGGKGQGFAADVKIKCWGGKKEIEKISEGLQKGEEIIVPQWEALHFKCTKNKTAPPYKEGMYSQWLTDIDGKLGEIRDEAKMLFRYAAHFNLLTKEAGTYTYAPTGFQTKTQREMREHLDEQIPDLKRRLLDIMLLRDSE